MVSASLFLGSGGVFAKPLMGMGATTAHAHLPEGRREGGHDLCPSPLEKWMNVVMALLIPIPAGNLEHTVEGEWQP